MRYLAIDLGDKRTGLALGDSDLRLAAPVDVLKIARAGDGAQLLDALVRAIDEHLGTAPGELVLGLPLSMDDSEGPRAKLARAFADRLAQRTPRRIHLHDERLTTAAADWSMARSGLTHKQKKLRRDALAAAALLQSFLNALPPARESPDA